MEPMGAWLSRAVAAETPSMDLAAGSEVADVEEATLSRPDGAVSPRAAHSLQCPYPPADRANAHLLS